MLPKKNPSSEELLFVLEIDSPRQEDFRQGGPHEAKLNINCSDGVLKEHYFLSGGGSC